MPISRNDFLFADLSNLNELPNYGLCNVPGVTHSYCMTCLQCELPNLLLESMPPDLELVDLIERAFLKGQIDSQKADLAYLWTQARSQI